MQGAALMGHLDESGGNARAIEMRLRALKVVLGEHAKADALALRLSQRALEREAVVAALLHPAQPDRVGILVAHDQTQHLDVEIAAGGEVARREHEMAGAGDVEGRIEVGLRNGHCDTFLLAHVPEKPAPDLIRGGNRFSDKDMRKSK
jgi:hypothetical protein